jgi:hypothetical protein
MPRTGPVERLLAVLADAPSTVTAAAQEDAGAQRDAGVLGIRPIAVGWATVELDRAADELAADLAIEPDAFVPAADSVALGARTRIARAVLPGGISIAILEPSTEGRLVAILVRHDEGPAAIWFEADVATARHAPAGRVVQGGGPFGPERLLATGPPDRFLVDRGPGTIAP